MRPTVTYDQFDVVVVPFPFTDKLTSKRRPAVIISNSEKFNQLCGHSVLAMITSAENESWPLDIKIKDLKESGLTAESVIRFKLFTLDHHLILKKVGRLSPRDRRSFRASLLELTG